VVYDAAPPYRVRRTATLDHDALQRALFDAEEKLGRRLDELPRPHLIDPHPGRRDVFRVDLDTQVGLSEAGAPGAQHVALWLCGKDLFARRELAQRALAARLSVDPYAMLDVVLRAEGAFPLDLLDLLRRQLSDAPASYASRALALRGEDLQRRLCVVVPEGVTLSRDFCAALMREVTVYREQSAQEALARCEELGVREPCARIMDDELPTALWRALAHGADADAICFRDVRLEAAWVRDVLER
jgi:hypothetical protein